MILTNVDIVNKIESLKPFLDRSDMIGYAAARNTRKLTDASVEYVEKQQSIMLKYGSEEFDDDGKATGRMVIGFNDPNFKKFKAELETYSILKHEITIFKIPYSEVIGKLTGSEILEIDWMLEDSDTPQDC